MLRSLLLYTALVIGANTAAAGQIDFDAAHAGGLPQLTEGNGEPASDLPFLDRDGNEQRLADYRGQVLLVNFWATWCAPCREEMPSLDRLQAEMGGEDFQVLTIATGRNPLPSIDKFLAEQEIENLPVLLDARQQFARSMGVMGLPVTVLIDREGNEAARLIGDADWFGDAARQVISDLTAP
ncbi:TlpA disulfide reductase family protein [uncultured Paracoccus sp.]|uniref:TlpA family protein disulfide reductase n=1 Tax=uncultured Paracoccus sp. TaxID=189685 RepID=UPI0025CC70D7|nr:TlpA disulfide reductase family protein [uncultured Paracoccus sp.]